MAWFVLITAFINAVVYRQRAAAIVSLVVGYLVSVWPPWLIGTHGHTTTVSALGLLAGLITLLLVAELIRVRNQRTVAIKNRQAEEARRRASEPRFQRQRPHHSQNRADRLGKPGKDVLFEQSTSLFQSLAQD